MRKLIPNLVAQQHERGVAILLSLGILSLVLILAMSYAFQSRTTHQLASISTDQALAKLVAESGVQRAIAFLEKDLSTEVTAKSKFFAGTGDWSERYYVSTISSTAPGAVDEGEGIREAMNIVFNGVNFTPAPNPAPAGLDTDYVGWVYQTVSTDTGTGTGRTGNRVVSRLAYMILADIGKADPGYWVSDSPTGATENSEAHAGDEIDELSLIEVLGHLQLSWSFQTVGVAPLIYSKMPNGERWHSFYDMYYSNPFASSTQALADSVSKVLYPYSIADDAYKYWRDTDSDSQIFHSDTEVLNQINVTEIGSSVTAANLYDAFTGYDATYNPNRDNISYFSPWLRSLSPGVAGTAAEKRVWLRQVAAQVAVNLVDYTDDDDFMGGGTATKSQPSVVSLDATTRAMSTEVSLPATSYESQVIGVEDQFVLGELVVALQCARNGANLTLRPYCRVELYNAFSSSDNAANNVDVSVTVDYTVTTLLGTTTINDTLIVTASDLDDYDADAGGNVHNNTIAKGGTAVPLASALDNTAGADPFTLDAFNIKSIHVYKNATPPPLRTLDYIPEISIPTASSVYSLSSSAGFTLMDLAEIWPALRIEAKDPRLNGFHQADARFTTYMNASQSIAVGNTSWANAETAVGDTFESALNPGGTADTWQFAYNGASTANYGDAHVANSAFGSVIEIGRVSGWQVSQSLRLWSDAVADESNHDGFLLDMFRDDRAPPLGRININGPHVSVLRGLFSAASTANAVNTANKCLNRNGTKAGLPLSGIGAISGFADLSAQGAANDHEAEQTDLRNMYRFATISQEYFTVLACAQALKDIGSWPTGTQPIPDAFAWRDDGGGNKSYAVVQSEQKIMAIVARDIFENKFKVLRFEYLED